MHFVVIIGVALDFVLLEKHYSCLGLTFSSLAVSLRTARFNIRKFYMVLALR
jgi:hypothetical protein